MAAAKPIYTDINEILDVVLERLTGRHFPVLVTSAGVHHGKKRCRCMLCEKDQNTGVKTVYMCGDCPLAVWMRKYK